MEGEGLSVFWLKGLISVCLKLGRMLPVISAMVCISVKIIGKSQIVSLSSGFFNRAAV